MGTYYSLIGVSPDADAEAIARAYQAQQGRYDPARVAELDPELRQVAAERSAELERAYRVLADPERRRQYDVSIGLAPAQAPGPAARRQVSRREQLYALAGALLGVGLIAAIWLLTGRGAGGPGGVAMGQTDRVAPAFSLPALGGGQVDLANYQGQVVLLNFWGTWCEPCKREMPALQAAHEQLGPQGLVVIGVNLTDDEQLNGTSTEQIAAFIEQFGVTYQTALDVEGQTTDDYRVFPLPTSFFIDTRGHIRFIHVGELTLEDVSARFSELRQEATALGQQ